VHGWPRSICNRVLWHQDLLLFLGHSASAALLSVDYERGLTCLYHSVHLICRCLYLHDSNLSVAAVTCFRQSGLLTMDCCLCDGFTNTIIEYKWPNLLALSCLIEYCYDCAYCLHPQSNAQYLDVLSELIMWAQDHRRISPPRLPPECRKRCLNQASFVLLCSALFAFSKLC